MEKRTKIDAEDGRQDLIITREFDLPVDLVFKAYSESELVEQWMGTKVIKLESRNHGSYVFETSYDGKIVFKANGTIHSVIPNQKIIRTFEMENAPIGVQLEILDFKKLTDASSKLTIQIIYQSEKHRAEQLNLPFAFGLNTAHNKLEELLTNVN